MVSHTNTTKKGRSIQFWLFVTVLIISILWLANWFLVEWFLCFAEGGQFGDRFGATTSLFGGLTIAGLIYTILTQQNEIKETKKKFDDEKLLLQKQIRIQRYQRFDNIFFAHIQMHQKIVEGLTAESHSIKAYVDNILRAIQDENDFELLRNTFQNSWEDSIKTEFAPYILNFQNTIDIIFTRKKQKSSQERYVKSYLCQLKDYELTFLFVYYTLKNRTPPANFNDYISILYTLISYVPHVDRNKGISAIASRWNARKLFDTLV